MQDFYQRVYEVVAEIPRGRVASYGQIARLLEQPHNARVVGWAMRQAPAELDLPCHRVVRKTGEVPPGFVKGKGNHVDMLKKEGITFDHTGKIDMKVHGWES